MRRLLVPILAFFILSYTSSLSAWNPMTVTSSGGAVAGCSSGADCSITFWLGMDGTDDGNNYTLHGTKDYTADGDYTSPAMQDNVDFNAAASDRNNGMDCPDNDSFLKMEAGAPPYLEGIYDSGDVVFFAKIRITDHTDGAEILFGSETDGSRFFEWQLDGTDEMWARFRDGTDSTTVASTDWNLTTATWYVIFFVVDDTGDDLYMYCYSYSTGNACGSTATTADTLDTWTGNGLYKFYWGLNDATVADVHLAVAGAATDITSATRQKILDYIRLTSDDYPG